MNSIPSPIKKGLDGVMVDETRIAKVFPEINALVYRGYPVQDLADHCSFMEVVYLLWKGELPSATALQAFESEVQKESFLSPRLQRVLEEMPPQSHPMDVLRTAISFMGMEEDAKVTQAHKTKKAIKVTKAGGTREGEAASSHRLECIERKGLKILAKAPLITATFLRHRQQKEKREPDPQKGFSEDFLTLCFGKEPHPKVVRAFDASLTLYAEHSFNASTFTSRVVASTLSDLYSAITAAIGALKGPLHGGANEQVMQMMFEIQEPSKAKAWLLKALKEKRKIMGFGHRVYKKGDSRVPTMKRYAQQMAEFRKETKWMEIYRILEETMIQEKNIYPNLDFPAGPAYHCMGFEMDFFTPLFVISRISGWVAHCMEQYQNNRLIRPLSHYVGEGQRDVLPLEKRG